MSPVLLQNEQPFENSGVHDIEAFGPVSTLMPYRDLDEAIRAFKKREGFTLQYDRDFQGSTAREYVVGCGYPSWKNLSTEPA